jgi:hypothetical protein
MDRRTFLRGLAGAPLARMGGTIDPGSEWITVDTAYQPMLLEVTIFKVNARSELFPIDGPLVRAPRCDVAWHESTRPVAVIVQGGVR